MIVCVKIMRYANVYITKYANVIETLIKLCAIFLNIILLLLQFLPWLTYPTYTTYSQV